MIKPDAEAFAHSALAMIASLLEDCAPIAARRLPEDPAEADQMLARLRQAGLDIAALAQSALSMLAPLPESTRSARGWLRERN